MSVELPTSPEQQLDILEKLKPKLGRFFQEMVYGQWGLQKGDVRLVDEAGFAFTGIPIYGPELTRDHPHIDIAVLEDKYRGPRSSQTHPKKIIFPMTREIGLNNLPRIIDQEYGLAVWDLLKGTPSIFSIPTIEVNLAGTPVLVPKPVFHVRVFAEETVLFYELRTGEGEEKIREWFEKLKMIRDVSQTLGRSDVRQSAQEVIEKSMARWASQNWDWMVVD